jgi:hypothetical protein
MEHIAAQYRGIFTEIREIPQAVRSILFLLFLKILAPSLQLI